MKKGDVVQVLNMNGDDDQYSFMSSYQYSIGVVDEINYDYELNICVELYNAKNNKIDFQYFNESELNKIGELDILMPCPCNPSCTCAMNKPCLGCETYGEWLNNLDDWRFYGRD